MTFHIYWKSISHLLRVLQVFLDLFAYLNYNVAILSNVTLWSYHSQITVNSQIAKLENCSFQEYYGYPVLWISTETVEQLSVSKYQVTVF